MRAATPVAVMAAMKEDTPAEAIAAEDTKTHFFIYAFPFCFLNYCGTIPLWVKSRKLDLRLFIRKVYV